MKKVYHIKNIIINMVIKKNCSLAIVDIEKIDEINILEASRLAMKLAIENLTIKLKKTENTYQLYVYEKLIGSFNVPYEISENNQSKK